MNNSLTNLAGGEYTPKIDVRIDTERYSSGCRRCENMIPRAYGSVTKRPGTEMITTSVSISGIVAEIVAYQNEVSCHEGEVVYTKYSTTGITCFEGDAVAYDSELITTSVIGYSDTTICHDNSIVFYDNEVVI